MAKYRITAPDGNTYEITAPDGATEDQVLAYAQQNYQQPKQEAQPRPSANNSDFARMVSGKKKPMGVMDALGREIGLGGRAAIRGVYDLTSLFGGDLINYAEQEIRGAPGVTQRQNADWVADKLGLPYPETATERVGGEVSSALVGGGGLYGLGKLALGRATGIIRGIGEAFTSSPGAQVVSATTGSGAAGVTREMGGSPGAQTVAGLVAGLGPAAVQTGGAAAVRGVARGGEAGRQAMERTIADFKAAGTTPTVGQASPNRLPKVAEVVLSRIPGGAGVIARKAEQQGQEIGAGVRRLSDDLAPGADPTTAGQAIRQGILGDRGFKQSQADASNRLYAELDAQIPQNSRVGVQNTAGTLSQLNPVIPGAPALTPMFQNGRIEGIKNAFAADTAPSGAGLMGVTSPVLPYEAVKKLRTQVGRELQNANFASDVPIADWSKLYGGLSDDMGAAAKAQGPVAERAFNRANDHFAAVKNRSEAIKHVVNQDTPEQIFSAAMQGTDKGATTLNALMKSLPDASRRQVGAAVLDRMGRAVGSQQNATGDAFSTATFLTNWAKLSPRAQGVLFDRFGPDFRAKVDAITRVADNLRTGSKIYANPSGTGAANAQNVGYGALAASGGAALMGNPLPLAGVVGGMAANNGLARLLTNPRAVDWLAAKTPMPYGVLAPALLASEQK